MKDMQKFIKAKEDIQRDLASAIRIVREETCSATGIPTDYQAWAALVTEIFRTIRYARREATGAEDW